MCSPAHTEKVLFDEKRATGAVLFEWQNNQYQSSQGSDFIAGAIGSPQILMLSALVIPKIFSLMDRDFTQS